MVDRTGTPLVELRDISISFGGIKAVDHVTVDLYPGEVVGLLGHNGAGKSTLIKCLSGAYKADAGQILINGHEVEINNPRDAREQNIETIYQTLALADNLDAASNLFLGRELRRGGLAGRLLRLLDRPRMVREAAAHLEALGGAVRSPVQTVDTLSGGQRQGIAVARSAAFARHVVILDEPTAALGVRESAHVLDLIRRVRDRGLAVILISHNMPHVFDLADRLHIQRLGRRILFCPTGRLTPADAVAVMTGATVPGAP